MTPPLLSQQVIVITGTSSGLGYGAALDFASQGATVVLVARRAAVLNDLAVECTARGGQALALPRDVSKQSDVEQVAAIVLARYGRIDTWINNAGVGSIGRFDQVPLEDHEQVLRTNLFGALYGSYTALKQFYKQGSGILINICSMLGKIPAPYYASYAASKSGIIGLTTSIQLELEQAGQKDIHACTVLPMAMDTPFFEHAGNYTGREALPIPPVYNAQKVVDTIVRLAHTPENEVIVGGLGVLADISHRIAPRLAEAFGARDVEKAQMGKLADVPPTPGAVHHPVMTGIDLHSDKNKF